MIEFPVPRHLARFVRRLRVVGALEPGEAYERLPDGETELIVGFGRGGTSATAIGTRTHALRKPASPRAGYLLVRFRVAGAYPFFGRPMAELTDEVVALAALWRRDAWAALEAAEDAATAARAVLAALTRVLAGDGLYEPSAVRAVRRAVSALGVAPRLPPVAQLARDIGVSERQLRRGFAEVVGVSPKRFVRVVRFRRALAAARATSRADWAAIAHDTGYFDQAHLIADFRALAGMPPGALVAGWQNRARVDTHAS